MISSSHSTLHAKSIQPCYVNCVGLLPIMGGNVCANARDFLIEETRVAGASDVKRRMPRCPQRCRMARFLPGTHTAKRRHRLTRRRVPTRLNAFPGYKQAAL